jgi:hypothetical protein
MCNMYTHTHTHTHTHTELVPKMRFLDKAGLSVFDMARFPQVFRYYSLHMG